MEKRLKIVFLSFYNGLVDRGVETFVSHLASKLAVKHQVLVLQSGPIKKTNYAQLKIPSQSIFEFNLKAIPLILRHKPDFLYPLNGRDQAFFCRLISLFNRTKLIIGGHAGIGKDDLFNLWLWPDIFVALSPKGKIWADCWAPHVKKAMITHGVDCRKFNPQVKPLKIGLNQPIVLTVAGKEKFKRLDLVIKAVSQLGKASLLIAGQPSKETIAFGGKLLGPQRFKAKKFLHSQMPEVYRSAAVFTLVSDYREAFGISYLEALASGLPVVATHDDLRRFIVGKAGILVSPAKIKTYRQALQKALDKNWGHLPRQQAKKFSWDQVADQYINLFKNLNK